MGQARHLNPSKKCNNAMTASDFVLRMPLFKQRTSRDSDDKKLKRLFNLARMMTQELCSFKATAICTVQARYCRVDCNTQLFTK